MNQKNNNSFFIFTKTKIFYIPFSDFFNEITYNTKNFNNYASKTPVFPDPILDSEIPITSTTVTNKNIILGFEDGKIHVYSYANLLIFNRSTPLKPNFLFSQHKGAITNISCVNRPISQYGLNFNNAIEEIIVKTLKKPSMSYTDIIPMKISCVENENFFENLINKNSDEKEYRKYNDYILDVKLEGKLSNKGGIEKLKNEVENNAKNKFNNSNLNLDDPKFLKRKLEEVSEILNKY